MPIPHPAADAGLEQPGAFVARGVPADLHRVRLEAGAIGPGRPGGGALGHSDRGAGEQADQHGAMEGLGQERSDGHAGLSV